MQIAWLVSFVRVLPVQSCLSSLVEAAYGSCVDSRICSLSQRIQVFGKWSRYLLCYVTNTHMPGAYIYPFNCCFHELKRRDLQQHPKSEIQLHDWFDQTHTHVHCDSSATSLPPWLAVPIAPLALACRVCNFCNVNDQCIKPASRHIAPANASSQRHVMFCLVSATRNTSQADIA